MKQSKPMFECVKQSSRPFALNLLVAVIEDVTEQEVFCREKRQERKTTTTYNYKCE